MNIWVKCLLSLQALVSNEVRLDLPSALTAAATLQPIPAGPDAQVNFFSQSCVVVLAPC